MVGRALIMGLSFLAAARAPESPTAPPKGWRYPTMAEISQDWRAVSPHKHALISADFDGDRMQDRAMLLVKANNMGAALVVILGRMPNKALVLEPLEDIGRLDVMGIEVVEPGQYETACGKGYFECEKGEPTVLSLKRPGINFFTSESASSYFYYDTKSRSFKRVWISD